MSVILDKLLNGQKFEWLPLNEIIVATQNIKWGNSDLSYKYIDLSSVDISTNKILNTVEINKFNAPSRAQKLVNTNDVIFATTRPTQMRLSVIPNELDGQIASTGYCILRANEKLVLPKWIFYNLSTKTFKNFLEENESGAAYPAISDSKLKEFKIPTPPLDIQAKIVKILDAFTALTAELTVELNMRKKQYHYYRNKLLTFSDDEVEWKTLDQFSTNLDSRRKPITSGFRESGEIPYYGASGIVDYVKDYIFDGDYLLISEDGANLLARSTPIAFSISGKTWVNNHAHVLKFKTYEERKFVEYYLKTIDLTPYISGAAQPKLNKQNLNSIKFPYPKLNEQKRIVAILDKFETITNSITEGLPKEIAVRQQQYEYYREQLLDFPKLNKDIING